MKMCVNKMYEDNKNPQSIQRMILFEKIFTNFKRFGF